MHMTVVVRNVMKCLRLVGLIGHNAILTFKLFLFNYTNCWLCPFNKQELNSIDWWPGYLYDVQCHDGANINNFLLQHQHSKHAKYLAECGIGNLCTF